MLFLGLSKVVYGTLNFGNTLISFSRYYYWTLFITIFLAIVSIGTNLYFIPILGLSGAALASLITVIVSYAYQQYIVQVKIKTNPFTWAHARIVVVIAMLYVIDHFVPSLTDISPILDAVVRSALIGLLGLVLIYKLNISDQISWFIRCKVLGKQ